MPLLQKAYCSSRDQVRKAEPKKPNIFVRAFRSLKNTFSRLAKYFRDVKSEMKKVVWPGKKQIINNTIVVLVVVAIASVVTLALDTGFITLLKLAIGA